MVIGTRLFADQFASVLSTLCISIVQITLCRLPITQCQSPCADHIVSIILCRSPCADHPVPTTLC